MEGLHARIGALELRAQEALQQGRDEVRWGIPPAPGPEARSELRAPSAAAAADYPIDAGDVAARTRDESPLESLLAGADGAPCDPGDASPPAEAMPDTPTAAA